MGRTFNPIFVIIGCSIPFVLWGILLILPTFDDWTTLSSPNYDPDFMKYVLPFGMTWRPGDAIMGYVNAIDYRFFPALNHILILSAHVGSTIVIYWLSRMFGFKPGAQAFATLFFYWSPCILGTVLSCDALNQSFSHLWGIMAVWWYLAKSGKQRYVGWVVFVLLSAWSKDNGIAWAVVPPMLSYAFGRINHVTLKRHFLVGLLIAVAYFIVRFLLPTTDIHNGSYGEDVTSLHSRVKGLAIWMAYTWSATDYISILHAPSRNLWLAAATFFLSSPFIVALFFRKQPWRQRTLWVLLACLVTVALPNLLISLSIMNAYASLGIAALIVGWLSSESPLSRRWLMMLFTLYMVSATFVNVHHWYSAWQTSLPSKQISRDIVSKTKHPVERAYCIIVHDDYPKYSSFCVPIDEAIGWGRCVWQATGYVWPQTINDTTIARTSSAQAEARMLGRSALSNGYGCVWIVDKDKVDVMQ